jgi:hypothetical protein
MRLNAGRHADPSRCMVEPNHGRLTTKMTALQKPAARRPISRRTLVVTLLSALIAVALGVLVLRIVPGVTSSVELKILGIALAVGLDVLALSIAVGIMQLPWNSRIRLGLAFSGSEVIMQVIGYGSREGCRRARRHRRQLCWLRCPRGGRLLHFARKLFGVPSRNGNYCTLSLLGCWNLAAEAPEAASGHASVGVSDIVAVVPSPAGRYGRAVRRRSGVAGEALRPPVRGRRCSRG